MAKKIYIGLGISFVVLAFLFVVVRPSVAIMYCQNDLDKKIKKVEEKNPNWLKGVTGSQYLEMRTEAYNDCLHRWGEK